MSDFARFRPVAHYDYLPTAPDAAKLFVITNVSAGGKALGEEGLLGTRAYPHRPTNAWSFLCYSISGRWNTETEGWYFKESPECSIDLVFREPFQALARGEDYYFLTASGKLYRAAKPAKGKHRTLEAVWDDARSPIVAFIQDADRNRTFLFCDSGAKGKGGPCVFELASGVRLRYYDKALFKPGDPGPESLRRVVGYARVLETLGYIKTAPADSTRQQR